MSALSEASTPAQDAAAPSIDTQQLQQHNQQLAADLHQPQQSLSGAAAQAEASRKPKAPSVRRACTACHTGKTRCSEVLPCQSCLKRGLGASCTYPDPDAEPQNHQNQPQPPQVPPFAAAMYPPPMQGLTHPHYYDYNSTFVANPPAAAPAPPPTTSTSTSATTSTFRPAKRPRPLTEEETAAITRNFTRGDFFVGSSAPVRIDPRLPVRLTLAEGDQVHFSIGEAIV
ncbi:hypothetical protein BC628DRAFT_1361300 [Trametes gibbosa]|nr:hypothetical protein BC628DRAFT_1361300 [Trametes gibbosa]UVI59139.1 Zn(2)-Cys(6)40 [Trametes gibbosa]